MYKNIGVKIKALAVTIFIIGTASSIIYAICYTATVSNYFGAFELAITFLIILAVGFLVSWLSTWLLYGFGELIDKTGDIEYTMHRRANESDCEKINILEKLHSQGLISDEEYRKKVAEIVRRF